MTDTLRRGRSSFRSQGCGEQSNDLAGDVQTNRMQEMLAGSAEQGAFASQVKRTIASLSQGHRALAYDLALSLEALELPP